MAKICPKCGVELEQGDKCPICGAVLEDKVKVGPQEVEDDAARRGEPEGPDQRVMPPAPSPPAGAPIGPQQRPSLQAPPPPPLGRRPDWDTAGGPAERSVESEEAEPTASAGVARVVTVYCPGCDAPVAVPLGARTCPKCGTLLEPQEAGGVTRGAGILELPALAGALTGRQGMLATLSGGVAIAVTLVLWAALRPFATVKSIESLLFPPQGSQAVPWLIVFLFLWGILLLVARGSLVRVEAKLLSSMVSDEAFMRRLVSSPEEVAEQIENTIQARPVGLFLERVRKILREWMLSRDAARVHTVASDQAMADAEALESGTNIIRVFIWAGPILGFIGTVLGISVAVQGFAASIQGASGAGQAAMNMSAVQGALITVANSLAFAFNTTLLGLLAALFLMLPFTYLQKQEDDLLTRVHEEVSEEVIPALPIAQQDIRSARAQPIMPEIEGLSELPTVLQEAAKSLRDAVTDLVGATEALSSATGQVTPTLQTTKQTIEATHAALTTLQEHVGQLSKAGTAFQAQMVKQVESLGGALASFSQNQERLHDAISAGVAAALDEHLSEMQRMVQDAMGAITDLSSVDLAGQVSTGVKKGLKEGVATVIQETLQPLIGSLEETFQQFSATSERIEKVMRSTATSIEALRQPFELRLVPREEEK